MLFTNLLDIHRCLTLAPILTRPLHSILGARRLHICALNNLEKVGLKPSTFLITAIEIC